jgi:hypothetical protein
MAFTVSFLPNTGNKFFLAACDEHLKLFDFEQGTVNRTMNGRKGIMLTETLSLVDSNV